MAQAETNKGPERGGPEEARPRRWRRPVGLGLAAAVLLAGGAAWLSRERIARDVIDDYLAARRVPATYAIVSLTPDRQVVENLVIGHPARPDLTIRRMVIDLGVGWSGPEVRRVSLEGVRLFASYRRGKFSLGALDPLVFTGGKEPPALPAIRVALKDARGLVESDYGRIGVSLAGEGRLDDGFAGKLAATAPGIGTAGCRAERATLYGRLTTEDGAPTLDGPLRLAGVACAGARLARADIGALASLAPDFAAGKADMKLAAGGASFASVSAAGLGGTARLDWSKGRLALGHDLALTGIATPQGRLARLAAEGSWRGAADALSGQWEGTLRGSGLAPAPGFDRSLAEAERSLRDTLLGPLIAKARDGLARALDGGTLRAEAVIRHKGSEATLTLPEASLAARSGTRVLALSRAGASIGARGVTGLGGNLLAGGEGLPNLNGRIEQDRGGNWTARFAMADYAAGNSRLAVPRLAIRGTPGGRLAFEGLVTASGPLPGGGVNDLTLPIEGSYAAAGGFAVGTHCTPVRFAKLALSGLALGAQSITLCPEGGAPILAWRDSLRFAARTGALNLTGNIGESPATLAASSVVLRYPQPFGIDNLAARIGTGTSEVRLTATSLTGTFAGTPGGTLAGGTARLAAVPFNLDAIAGDWSFADGALRLSDAAFTLSDRPADGAAARFVPLAGKAARLTLLDNRITADARLDHPASGRQVLAVQITHDLESAAGTARLTVPGLVFGKGLQPDDLTPLAEGVVALADGTITGTGRVDWEGEKVTSGGTFSTDHFDFAAAFGPVRGLAGTVVFTDLINLTTAPDQVVTIEAINPGVEVLAGKVRFDLADGTRLALKDARFPFMGGTLVMRPLVMDLGAEEERRYIFEIVGLDAAKFVAEMELKNLSATGIFDGTVPIIFDEQGRGRIEGGVLVARSGGGNVAYIGELSYENLGTMGNYAFAALRSLDYRQMRVGLGGDLDGEIVTSFEFDGIRQGAGASQNFVTRRLAKLPIRFRINVRSENFQQLATMVRSMWDANYIRDPQSLGLFRQENGRLVPIESSPGAQPAPVQPPASEDKR
ncbi:MAG: YdbH domain-containing protein [Erythrobacter sp.]